MSAALPVQLGPIYYLAGAVVVAVVLVLVITVRHRRPKSLEANVESFNRGLQALSPHAPDKRRRRRAAAATSPTPLAPSSTLPPINRVVTSTVVVTHRPGSEAGTG